MPQFDFAAENRRPAAARIVAAWKRAGCPGHFTVTYGETFAEFELIGDRWDESGTITELLGPMWRVRFADGYEDFAYGDEIGVACLAPRLRRPRLRRLRRPVEFRRARGSAAPRALRSVR